jgi:hypothetical protein
MQNSFFRRNRDLAEDNLNKARVNNGTLIVNDDQYIQNYLTLKFDQAASDLSDHKQDIEFLKKRNLKTLNNVKIKVEK